MGHDGQQIGIKPLPEALAIARELDLDLVEVAAQANPPVCRIMDYGKYKYEAAQKAKESRRKTTNVVIKEMKYRPKIGEGRLRHQDPQGRAVPRRGPQGEGHADLPRPRDVPPRARQEDPRRGRGRREGRGPGRDLPEDRRPQHDDGPRRPTSGPRPPPRRQRPPQLPRRRGRRTRADAAESTATEPTPSSRAAEPSRRSTRGHRARRTARAPSTDAEGPRCPR